MPRVQGLGIGEGPESKPPSLEFIDNWQFPIALSTTQLVPSKLNVWSNWLWHPAGSDGRTIFWPCSEAGIKWHRWRRLQLWIFIGQTYCKSSESMMKLLLCKPAEPKTNSSENIYVNTAYQFNSYKILTYFFLNLVSLSNKLQMFSWALTASKMKKENIRSKETEWVFFLVCFVLGFFLAGDWTRINLEVYQSGEADEKRILSLNWKSVMNNVHVWIAQRLDTTSLTTTQILHYHRGRELGWA